MALSRETQIILSNIKAARTAIIKEIKQSRDAARVSTAKIIKVIRKSCK